MRNRRRFQLADEIHYIQRRAAARDGRDQLVLFSTETGDAWLLDPSDHVAARLARDGDLPISRQNKMFAVCSFMESKLTQVCNQEYVWLDFWVRR